MGDHINALILSVLAEALESDLVTINTQFLNMAVQGPFSMKKPIFYQHPHCRILQHFIHSDRTPFEDTVSECSLHCKRGEQLQAAGAGDDTTDVPSPCNRVSGRLAYAPAR